MKPKTYPLLAAIVAAAWLTPARLHGGTVHWMRTSARIQSQAIDVTEVPCGALGYFYFSQSQIPAQAGQQNPEKTSAPANSMGFQLVGAEEPPLYTLPAALDAPGWGLAGQSWFGNQQAPWVAVLDFANGDANGCADLSCIAHGHAVAWAIRLLSGETANVMFYAIDEELPALGQPAASDVHVVLRLCEVAQYLRESPGNPPVALNMSFGRLDDGDTGVCDPEEDSELSCQIRAILDYLFVVDVTLIAAAGNHETTMFPAGYEPVLSTGRLNLHGYEGVHKTNSWQNPPGTAVLFPGDGLSLVRRQGPGRLLQEPLLLPSGSSFAAASFTGVVADLMPSGWGAIHPADGVWFPRREGSTGTFYLYNDHQTWLEGPTSQPLTDLFARLKTMKTASTVPVQVAEPMAQSGPGFTMPGAASVLLGNGPSPAAKPCLPCIGNLHANGLTIDMTKSQGFPSSWSLQDVFLRIGTDEDYQFEDATVAALLTQFNTGAFGQIQFPTDGIDIQPHDQVALVFTLKEGAKSFWVSANVLIPDYLIGNTGVSP